MEPMDLALIEPLKVPLMLRLMIACAEIDVALVVAVDAEGCRAPGRRGFLSVVVPR